MRKTARERLVSIAQRALFSFEQFARHEMANHAAAGAYSFLLSAIPAVLVILFISSRAVLSLDNDYVLGILGPFIDSFGAREVIMRFIDTPLAGYTGAVGLINLVWAARLFIVSIQRGLRVINAGTGTVNPVRENVLTFVLELVVIVAVVLIIFLSQTARVAIDALGWVPAARLLGFAIRSGLHILPFSILWLFVFLTLSRIPVDKPSPGQAALSATLCVVSYSIFGALLGLTLNTARYGLLYGILGNLIIALIKVYFFFWLYFFFAELCFTLKHFDSLLFARFHRIDSVERAAGRLERALFAEPGRLIRRYARNFKAGETIFSQDDTDKSALYLYRGSVGIYLAKPGEAPPGTRLSTVKEGEFFGEMAWILEEPRSALALAGSDCTVFVLPPEMFEQFLAQDADASRRLAELLALRLKANNERLIKAGLQ